MLSARSYLTRDEYDLVSHAHRFLEESAVTQVEIEHALETANLLAMWEVRAPLLVATLIAPLIRYRAMSEAELCDWFKPATVQMAQHALRLIDDARNTSSETITKADRIDRQGKLFRQAYDDVEVVLIVAADRLVQTMLFEKLDKAFQQAWAQDNITVFLPLLELLGLWAHRRELGNLSLAVVNPAYFKQLQQHIASYRKKHQELFDIIAETLYDSFEEQAINNALIRLHNTTAISLHQRIEQARRRGSQRSTNDASILYVDVVLETVRDCYHALGLIHNQWRPAHRQNEFNTGRFLDYIAAPRYNGYRCLITTVLCEIPMGNGQVRSSQKLVEFRIRTQAMEQINTLGITAAMQALTMVKNAWWSDSHVLATMRSEDKAESNGERDAIGVFTPTGEVLYPLKPGCTMVDIAFRVHSALGPYARRFWANGQSVSYEYQIKHGDLVEVEYDMQYPSLERRWQEFAVTSSARRAIRRILRQREKSPHIGRNRIDRVLEREINIYQMRLPDEKIENALLHIARSLNCSSLDALYMRVLEGEISPDEVVATIIERELVGHIVRADNKPWPATRIHIARSWMQEKAPAKWDRATRVIPGTDIVGRVQGQGKSAILVVHRRDSRNAPKPEQAVPLLWRATSGPREIAEISVTAPPRSHVIGMVLNAMYGINKDNEEKRLDIQHFESHMRDGSLTINMNVDAPGLEDLEALQDALGVIKRSGYITTFRAWQLFPGQRMLLAARSDRRQQNPYTLRQVRDQSMFFGRNEEIERILDHLRNGNTFIVLYGQKRIGKTSLIYQLADNLIPQTYDILPVNFDAHRLSSFDTIPFMLALANATHKKLEERLRRGEDRRGLRLRESSLKDDPFGGFAQWVRKVEEQLQGTKLLFMIDEFTRAEEEFERGRLDPAFFDGMQYLVGNADIGFLVCVHDYVYLEGSRSWGMLQRGQPIRLSALDRESAARLVRQPLERLYRFDNHLVENILDLTDCHPYFIQAICQSLITHMSQKDSDLVSERDLDRATTAVLVTGDHYFSHYRSRTDHHNWDTLKIIAYITDQETQWAASSEIRDALKRFGHDSESWQISKSLGDLVQAGIIETRNTQGQATYRIPVGMFRIWLQQVVTHPIASQNAHKEDMR